MIISVVIPVYNAEKYLQRCISSIRNQTYSNWEMVLVDDGSKDDSLDICQKNAADDKRIKVIHQSNKGPGEARNVGIAATTGDYIVFVDADDFIDKEYFQLLSKRAEGNDVIFIDVQQRHPNGKKGKNEYMSKYNNKTLEDIVRSCMTGYFPWGGVRKVASAKLIKDNNVKYGHSKIGEEAVFTYKVLSAAKSFTFIDNKPVYYYELHDGSQSSIPLDDPWGDTFLQMKQCLLETGKYDQYADTLNSLNVMATVASINNISIKNSICSSIIKSKNRVREYKVSLDDNYNIDRNHLPLKAKVWIPYLNNSCVVPLVLVSKMRHFLRRIKRYYSNNE